MSSTTTSLINYNFGGIRRKDSVFSNEKVTCSDCQNVELFFTKLNSGVGIRTASGNTSVTQYIDANQQQADLIPDGEEIIGIFETIQDGSSYCILYTESETEGKLYNYNRLNDTMDLLVDDLNVTGKACGTDFTQGWLDIFVFSNGVDVKYIYSDTETHEHLVVEVDENIHLIDPDDRDVSGLGLVVFDSRLWIFNGRVLWYSKQAECRDFSFVDPDLNTSAGYIEFVKPITAIYPYLGSLAVFHKNSSCLVTLDQTTRFKAEDESPGGCASYNSLVFHGTDLYFYDDTKKGVFSFKQIVNGDKTLGDNIAYDIQEELLGINQTKLDNIRSLSVVTSDRNEVWFLVPISTDDNYSYVLIFDYIRGEWVKRKCQHINALGIVNNTLFSGGNSLYEEYVGYDFNGEFIESFYTCTAFNLGSDNTLKITKMPPRATLDSEKKCNFWVKYVKNYDTTKTAKEKELKGKTQFSVLRYDSGYHYDEGWVYSSASNVILKFPTATFKTLEITICTKNRGDSFALKTLEFSKIKVKQV